MFSFASASGGLFSRNGCVEVIARHRNGAASTGELELEHDLVTNAERRFARGQVEAPHAAKAFGVDLANAVEVGHEATVPVLQRIGIVIAQYLYIGDDEPRALDHADHLRHRRRIAPGKNVMFDPGIGDVRRRTAADGVHQCDAAVVQAVPQVLEILAIVRYAYMLEHSHRYDPVKAALNVTVILQSKLRVAGKARFAGAPAGLRLL